ncbi:hypothetical protein AMTRI_Chr03g50300 [Amborella trichopoda]
MTTLHVARAPSGHQMRNPVGNDTPKDAIIIVDDEALMAMIEEDSGHTFRVRTLPYSGWILFTLAWFTTGGIVSEQLRIPFSTQVEGLDYLSADIGGMEYGKELLKALPKLLERTPKNLTAFTVPEASKLKKIMGELLNPSIGHLLDFASDQPSIFGYVEGLLMKLKSDLAYREGFHPTLEAHSLKEGEDAALGETETLLSQVCEEMSDLPLTDLESCAFPFLARHAGSLKVVELKDKLGIRQHVFIEIGAYKE